MDKRLFEAVEKQINSELYNSYLYLSMALWAEAEEWSGFANWMRVQAQEELGHGTVLIDQLHERGMAPKLLAIDKPPTSWNSLLEMAEATLEAELGTTAAINNIADIALEVKDHAFYEFIMMYVKEQVEEEDSANKMITKLKRIGDSMGLLYQLDAEYATRVFVPPFTEGA